MAASMSLAWSCMSQPATHMSVQTHTCIGADARSKVEGPQTKPRTPPTPPLPTSLPTRCAEQLHAAVRPCLLHPQRWQCRTTGQRSGMHRSRHLPACPCTPCTVSVGPHLRLRFHHVELDARKLEDGHGRLLPHLACTLRPRVGVHKHQQVARPAWGH